MPRRRIIPVFVPHMGCPHQCVFCDQRQISGAQAPVTAAQLRAILDAALSQSGAGAELAFYGGSFTAIGEADQVSLLEAAQPYLRAGHLFALRCSTRPDCIDESVIARLRRYGMQTVELGCQSMNDEVLRRSGRGHTALDCEHAIALLKSHGFSVVAQLMTGLPGSSDATDLESAERIAALHPDGVRIYPTVVVEGTPLAAMYQRGIYSPQALESAVNLCARMWELFRYEEIPVLRVGLNPSESLHNAVLAGPYHPAFGELVLGRMYYNLAKPLLAPHRGADTITLCVAPRAVSRMVGQKKTNLRALEQEFSIKSIKISAEPLEEWEIRLQTEGNTGIVDRIDR